MDLSIIVPVHNLENYITPLLVSLRLQVITKETVEIIFVCDNCTDKTEEVIREFNFDHKFNVKLIRVNNKSCGLSRNSGLEIASGNLIWFIDGDDWIIDPFAIGKIVRVFKENPNTKLLRFKFDHPDTFKFSTHPAMVWQYTYKRDLIGDTRFLPIQPDEDKEFMKIILKKIENFSQIEDKLYYYNYLRPNSNMQQIYETGKITI